MSAASHHGLLASMLAPGERYTTRVVKGRGAELTLEDGTVVIDCGSMSSCLVGHCHPAIVEAIERAARTVYVGDCIGYGPREQAAEDLLAIGFAGEDWADAVTLTVSSSEAGDLGLLLAQTLTGRAPLVARELAYHGGVGLSRAVSVHPLWSARLASLEDDDAVRGAPPSGPEVRRLPAPICGIQDVPAEHSCREACLRDADTILDGAAAVIMDNSQGCVYPSAQYQDVLAERARAAGALWIADETVTGFGRLGHPFAFTRGSSRPDMVSLGKGLTGGSTAAGALVLSREVVEEIGASRWTTSSTFRGSPVAAAAISATMRVMEDEDLIARAATLGADLGADLRALAREHRCVSRVVGDGLLWFLALDTGAEHAEASWNGGGANETLPEVVHHSALKRGAFVGAQSGQNIWLIPPLIITASQLAQVLEAVDGALSDGDRLLESSAAGSR